MFFKQDSLNSMAVTNTYMLIKTRVEIYTNIFDAKNYVKNDMGLIRIDVV